MWSSLRSALSTDASGDRRINRLYCADDLYRGYEPSSDAEADKESYNNCYDGRTYQYYLLMGKNAKNVNEALARTLHDHGIHMALDAFLDGHDSRRCIGVMGGHAMLRTQPMYADIVMLSKRLTEEGFFMLTGGGPGAMEATHLGAWMAGRTRQEVEEALKMLAIAPRLTTMAGLRRHSVLFAVIHKVSM